MKRLFVSDFRWLMNCEAVPERKFFDRRRGNLVTAPGGTIRLCPDGDNLMPIFKSTLQGRHSRLRCAHEN